MTKISMLIPVQIEKRWHSVYDIVGPAFDMKAKIKMNRNKVN